MDNDKYLEVTRDFQSAINAGYFSTKKAELPIKHTGLDFQSAINAGYFSTFDSLREYIPYETFFQSAINAGYFSTDGINHQTPTHRKSFNPRSMRAIFQQTSCRWNGLCSC